MQLRLDSSLNSYYQIIITQCNKERKPAVPDPVRAVFHSQVRGRGLGAWRAQITECEITSTGGIAQLGPFPTNCWCCFRAAFPFASSPTHRSSLEKQGCFKGLLLQGKTTLCLVWRWGVHVGVWTPCCPGWQVWGPIASLDFHRTAFLCLERCGFTPKQKGRAFPRGSCSGQKRDAETPQVPQGWAGRAPPLPPGLWHPTPHTSGWEESHFPPKRSFWTPGKRGEAIYGQFSLSLFFFPFFLKYTQDTGVWQGRIMPPAWGHEQLFRQSSQQLLQSRAILPPAPILTRKSKFKVQPNLTETVTEVKKAEQD